MQFFVRTVSSTLYDTDFKKSISQLTPLALQWHAGNTAPGAYNFQIHVWTDWGIHYDRAIGFTLFFRAKA